MKESKTAFSYLVEHMESPSFNKIRGIACDFVRKLPHELCDELHIALNRGVDILDSEALLQMYLYSFGDMHAAKLNYAFENLNECIKREKEVELIDYGCGQGIASMCYHDYIKNVNPTQIVSKIILIEPSEMALSRASLLCEVFFPNAKVITINKNFEKLSKDEIQLTESVQTIHLFSNILDVESYDIVKFAEFVKSISVGENEYVITSPCHSINRLRRLSVFVNKLDVNKYFERYFNKREFREDKDWTCAVLLCSTKTSNNETCFNIDDVYEEASISKNDLDIDNENLANAWEDENGVRYSRDRRVLIGPYYDWLFGEEYIIPEGTIEIRDVAFVRKNVELYQPNHLKRIIIPSTVKKIGVKALPGKYEVICNSPFFTWYEKGLYTSDFKEAYSAPPDAWTMRTAHWATLVALGL